MPTLPDNLLLFPLAAPAPTPRPARPESQQAVGLSFTLRIDAEAVAAHLLERVRQESVKDDGSDG
jgi:hypothetical protein